MTARSVTGDIIGDLATRRGRVMVVSRRRPAHAYQRVVPLAELTDYQSRVKSLTGGGSY
jgi:elongation factor G